jgi:hypothetical protein
MRVRCVQLCQVISMREGVRGCHKELVRFPINLGRIYHLFPLYEGLIESLRGTTDSASVCLSVCPSIPLWRSKLTGQQRGGCLVLVLNTRRVRGRILNPEVPRVTYPVFDLSCLDRGLHIQYLSTTQLVCQCISYIILLDH